MSFILGKKTLWDKGLETLQDAESLERVGEHQAAYESYTEGISMLLKSINNIRNPSIKEKRRNTINIYLQHAELLKSQLLHGGPPPKPIRHPKPVKSQSSFRRTTPIVRPKPQVRRGGRGVTKGTFGTSSTRNKKPNVAESKQERGSKYEQSIYDKIESEILTSSPGVKFDDLAGLEQVKRTLYETVILPSQRPDVFTGLRAPPKGILLFGPPGNGKTLVAKAVATECDACFFSISASSLTSKYVGEGEKLMRALFTIARERQPSIIFFDEIDSLLTARSSGENDASRRMKTEFLIQFDGVGTDSEDKILVIGATNLPQELDDAVIRRFAKRILLPLPDPDTRQHLILHLLKKEKHNLSKPELAAVVRATAGYSCSDLSQLVKDAAMGPVRDAGLDIVKMKEKDIAAISVGHFEESVRSIRPSTPQHTLDLMEKWNEQFGSKLVSRNNAATKNKRRNSKSKDGFFGGFF